MKNDNLSGTVENMSDASITEDEHFKNVIRYKCMAALLMKFTIPYFKDKSLEEIARAIIDTNGRDTSSMSKAGILEDEVDFIQSEIGAGEEKKILPDTVFNARIGDETIEVQINTYDKVTVNIEMQNKTKNLGYSLVSRAIYYGASLLRSTIHRKESYSKINKVYTIWFCNDNIEFEFKSSEIANEYVHRFGFRRYFDGIPDKQVPAEKDSDLIEVVMVELHKLRKEDSDTANMVYRLFNQTDTIVDAIEKFEGVELEKVKKGVFDVTYAEMRLKEAERIERENARKAEELERIEREAEEVKREADAIMKENEELKRRLAELEGK